jgi:hypothetical protein
MRVLLFGKHLSGDGLVEIFSFFSLFILFSAVFTALFFF